MTADGAAAFEALRSLACKYRGRVWPATKAQIKAAVATIYLSRPQWLTHWARTKDLGKTEEKAKKNVAKVFKREWRQLGVLSGSKKSSFKWNTPKIDSLLAARQPEPQSVVCQSETPDHAEPVDEPSKLPIHVVESAAQIQDLLAADAALRGETKAVVAVDCEGVPEELYLVQVATSTHTFVFDCMKLGAREVCEALAPLLTSQTTIKLLHDLHKDAVALHQLGSVQLCGCLDSQLAMELLVGTLHIGFNDLLKQLGHDLHPSKHFMKKRMDESGRAGGSLFAKRPLPRDVLEYAAMDVSLLLGAYERLQELLGDQLSLVQRASDVRALHATSSGGRRRVCVDVSNQYALASRELIETCRPEAMEACMPLSVSNDIEPLLALLPEDVVEGLNGMTVQLSDIVLDKGRRPQAWCAGERAFLCADERLVTPADIDAIVSQLGGFGSDNRAGLEAQLHRISAVRNRADAIIGLTMRVGRHVAGNAAMIADLLFHDDGSILFLGEPGSGKTTIVREATRLLAEMSNVLIVDTSNEIAGDGDVPHPCVGLARRLQVRSLDEQSNVMVEGVQNHTPEVMVIDEIGRPAEVEAARTVKQRGVRMIASAHGDLRKLLKNKQLRGLIGGVEAVTMGDAMAKEEAKKRGGSSVDKIKAQRAGAPIFDVIIELRRGVPHEWRIVTESAKAVDQILDGSHYLSQLRTRDPLTGEFYLELEKA
eukprot:Transcript_10487.p1 GENE.Transcript_10487~~Transcript_10487.p1  ORF type:complete len:831 (-),score=192.75 Transcript_10487:133-2262(-)